MEDSATGVTLFDLTDRVTTCQFMYTPDDPPGAGLFTIRDNPEREESAKVLTAALGSGVVFLGRLYSI